MSDAIKYADRKSGEICTENVMGDAALKFAYNTLLGRSLWGLLFGSGLLSSLMGKYYDSPLSAKNIKSLISIPGLNADEAEKPWNTYKSFNDFFTRKLKSGARPYSTDPEIMVSPADGRVLFYCDIEKDQKVPVKGALRSLAELCKIPLEEKKYHAAVIRLAPVDYHRFHFPCDCVQKQSPLKIKGKYHSVNPIAFKKAPDLFVENTRAVTVLESELFGKIFYLEVGAFGVGSIVHLATEVGNYCKMDEKGFFKFGGSTVILLFEADKIEIDADLKKNSQAGIETLIRCGERIGCLKKIL